MVLSFHDNIIQAVLYILSFEYFAAVVVFFGHAAAPKSLYANDILIKFRVALSHLREILGERAVHQHR